MKQTTLWVTGLCFAISAQSTDTTEAKINKNAIGSQPLSLYSGVVLNYEHLFSEKSGLFVEGSASLWDPSSSKTKGFGLEAQYRRHRFVKPKHKGISSPYWGPSLYFEKSRGSTDVTVSNGYSISKDKIYYDLTALRMGVSNGRRWVFDSGFNIDLHWGYGFFPLYEISWDDPQNHIETSDKDRVETFAKILGGIDFGFSLGFAF